MSLEKFSDLPIKDLISPSPAFPRDSSSLMILRRKTGEISHSVFRNIPDFLREGDVLILNKSKVRKAKLDAVKDTGGKCEILLLFPLNGEMTAWKVLARKLKEGSGLIMPGGLQSLKTEKNSDSSFNVEFSGPIDDAYLEKFGLAPLPEYILKARKNLKAETASDDENLYQTVYAEIPGSVAAPTAGFHFTPDTISRLKRKGIIISFVTLHIGWGTFRPVRGKPENHRMLPETAFLPPETAERVNAAKKEGRRVIPVGTSSMRTMESFADENGFVRPGEKKAELFIRPGYRFKTPDGFITNFHVPSSAPLFMTAAFAGEEFLFRAYSLAVKMKYRFYSYGDSMLIL